MPVLAVIGGQFGDEAKGKVIDSISAYSNRVVGGVRYAGGNNAGHTVVLDKEYKLHLVPSTVFNKKPSIIGHGTVVDPDVLENELTELRNNGFDTDVVVVSENAHVIMPYHILLDRLLDALKSGGRVGTTGRGIGPCYADKAYRVGIQMKDLLNPNELARKLSEVLPIRQKWLEALGYDGVLDQAQILEHYLALGRQLG